MKAAILPALFSLMALATGALCRQEATKRFTHPVSKDADGGMARWMATCKPSAAHARLAELLGTYDATTRLHMAPGQPPMELPGTCEVTWLVEGKWLLSQMKGTGFDGKPMTTTSILGYDNFKERYVLCAVDSLQTCMSTASGHFDQSGDHLILWGTIDEPMTPEQDKMVKYVFRDFGQDERTFEVHDMMIGETDTRVLEIAFARKR